MSADLRSGEFRVRTGPFVTQVCSPLASVLDGFETLYADYPCGRPEEYPDFRISILPAPGLRRWLKKQAIFCFEGREIFEPMPVEHAFPLLEWSMNWCVAMHAHQYLLLHSAVIERNGHAVVMPAPPGSGKSTLCAGLIHAGWRLVSDEMALLDRAQVGTVWPLCRPVSLKNASIDVLRARQPEARFNSESINTNKGRVCHMRVDPSHVARMDEPAQVRWVVFPRWTPGAPAALRRRSRADSMVELAHNAFNYGHLGAAGFEQLVDVVGRCDCYDFTYSSLDEAVDVFDRLPQVLT